MNDEITIGGVVYISSKRAAMLTEYSQDYIGQLARSSIVESQRVGGLWYVKKEAILSYSPEVRSTHEAEEGTEEKEIQIEKEKNTSAIIFEGKEYISASRASHITGYNQDYIGQLARANTIPARQVGSRWFVESNALVDHKKEKDRLLAAVQANSVGLVRPAPEVGSNEVESIESYTYRSDTSDLMPQIRSSPQELPSREQEEEHAETAAVAVPIRIAQSPLQDTQQLSPVESSRFFATDRPWQFMLTMGKVPAALTVVIILSFFGYFSLSKQAQYASVATSTSVDTSVKSELLQWLSRIGTTELVYIRSRP